MLAAFLTTILFSVSAVSGNRTARLLGGTEANFWRLCLGAVLLAIYAHTAGGGIAGPAFPTFLLSGCIGFGIGDMALYQALPRIGSRLSVLLTLCLSSPLAALIEWAWLGTRLSTPEMICAGIILAGVALALAPGHVVPGRGPDLAVGLTFGSVASFCQGLGAVLSRKAFSVATAAHEAIDGITAAYQRILGGLAIAMIIYAAVRFRSRRRTAPVADARDEARRVAGEVRRDTPAGSGGPEPAARHWRRAWPWLLLNGLAGPALGVSCYQWALKTTPTGVVLPIVAITPIVIIPFAYAFEHERPTARSLLGGLLAVLGAVALAWVKYHGR